MAKSEFWKEKVEWKENGDKTNSGGICVRINGKHYTIMAEDAVGKLFRGHSARQFIIKFISGPHKGKLYYTTNLWQQGEIDAYKTKLSDNAIFIASISEIKGQEISLLLCNDDSARTKKAMDNFSNVISSLSKDIL